MSYLWLDLETTGTDPTRHRILEIAAVIVDEDLSIKAWVNYVINQDGQAWLDEMIPVVREMHTRNGLIDDCLNGVGTDLAGAETAALYLASELGDDPIVLAGSTVAFDRGFIIEHMPALGALLSHRCFDVSTLKMAERDWCGGAFRKAEAHRALPDVLESLQQAREIRSRRFA